MKRLFLNYRIEDTQPTVARLAAYLEENLLPGQVFWDVEGIAGGEAWGKRIEHEVHRADVVFVILGARWLTLDGEFNQRRIDEETDWVRCELEIALARLRKSECAVLPVFVDRVEMPPKRALPKSIRALPAVQGRMLRTTDWEHDVDGLLRWLVQKGFAPRENMPLPLPSVLSDPAPPPVRRGRRWLLSGAVAIVAALLAWMSWPTPEGGMAMVRIPGGRFLMGSPDSDPLRDPWEGPQHEVTVAPFLLAKTELTRAEFRAVMPAADVPEEWTEPDEHGLPADSVEFLPAVRCCNALSARDGLSPYYAIEGEAVRVLGGRGYRLPSEAEWEHACRAGTTTNYCSGDTRTHLELVGWYDGNSERSVQRVAELRANAFGVYDMHGNVCEWCEDTWHDGYDGAPADGRAWVQADFAARVLRGGSFRGSAAGARSAARIGWAVARRSDDIGFRLARSVEP